MYIQFSRQEEALPKYFTTVFFQKFKIGLVVSLTGSTWLKSGCGKSYCAMRLGELIDKDFNISKVAFTPRQFLEALDEIEQSGKKGQVVILDEGEISAPSQLWYSFTNKAIFYTLVTFRYLRSMAIIVTPSLYWIDKRLRTLTSHWGYTEVEYPEERTRKYFLRMFKIKTDLFGEKIFLEKLRFYNALTKQIVITNRFSIEKPSKELIEAYEEKAKEFKSEIRKSVFKEMEKFEKYSGRVEKKDLNQLVSKAIENPLIRKDLEEKGRVTTSILHYALAEHNLTFHEVRVLSKLIKEMWNKK